MAIELRPHQKEALAKLKKSQSLLLYHGLGSGKTLSSIFGADNKTTVVVPASLRTNYEKEVVKAGRNPKKFKVMSYEGFNKKQPKTDSIVFDEVHRLGNSSSVRTQKALKVIDRFKRKILLTGTPAKNHPYELAPILRLLNPKAKGVIPLNTTDFNNKFIETKVTPISFYDKWIKGLTPGEVHSIKNKDILREIIKGRVHYHANSDKGFPSVIEHTEKVDMSDSQRDIYNTVTNNANVLVAAKVRSGLPPNKKDLRSLNAFMNAARIVSNNPKAYGGTEISNKVRKVISNLKRFRKQDIKHKAVIYSNYIEGGLEPIIELLKENKIPYNKFTGGLSDKQRRLIVEQYNNGTVPNLLISGAGAEGLDLKRTNSMHLLEPHWNEQRMDQVKGRSVRYQSHLGLPKDKQKVDIYNYQSVLPKTYWEKLTNSKKAVSADEYLTTLASDKQKLLNSFLDILKENK